MIYRSVSLLALFAGIVLSNQCHALKFGHPAEIDSSTGYLKINWESRFPVELQFSHNEDFSNAKTLYQGKDKSFFVSGLKNGTYFFRLRPASSAIGAAWSPPLRLKVTHHSMSKTVGLLVSGALVFFMILVIVFNGTRRYREGVHDS